MEEKIYSSVLIRKLVRDGEIAMMIIQHNRDFELMSLCSGMFGLLLTRQVPG